MDTTKKTARIAGLLYFLIAITGIFSLMYVPSKLLVWDNPATTVANLKSSEFLFRLEILGEILCYLIYIFLPLVLFQLFKNIHKNMAVIMVILVFISIPISMGSVVHKLDVLSLLGDSSYLNVYSPAQLEAKVMGAFHSYFKGILVAQIFWGLWLFPFGYLLFKSGFLPKILGLFLMVGSIGYFLDAIGRILCPDYNELWLSDYITIPASIGELGSCLWLLIFGIKTKNK